MSLNLDLQNRLEDEFKPLGIVAYSNCCRIECTGTYEEEDEDFECRDKGIYFIRLHLDGMNYNQFPKDVYAQYSDFDYLMENWDEECALIRRWAQIVGVDVQIEKPEDSKTAIHIIFSGDDGGARRQPLILEEPIEGSESE